MLESGEVTTHKLHGSVEVLNIAYKGSHFIGAYLRPRTEEGRESLKQAGLNNDDIFFESDPSLLKGAQHDR